MQAIWRGILGLVYFGLLWLGLIAPAGAEGFVLCPDSAEPCARASYFVGYEQSQQGTDDSRAGGLRLYPGVADGTERASSDEGSTLQIEALRVGETRNRQNLSFPALEAGTTLGNKQTASNQTVNKTETQTDLLWGDTFRISSTRLSVGDPVALRVGRAVVNKVEAQTDLANERLVLQTWINGHVLPKLDYQLAKFAGRGENVREQGERTTSVSVLVKVGEIVHLESRLRMQSGLRVGQEAQVLAGTHGVHYQVDLLSDDSCARSESGLLTTGDCD